MKLCQYYLSFMRIYVDKKYFEQFKDLTVLGERFIGRYYIVVFQIKQKGSITYHLLIENIPKAKQIELKPIPHKDKYISFGKIDFIKSLQNIRLYRKLVRNGLFQNLYSGLSSHNSYFSLHRLVFCLYLNCLNAEIHHINKIRWQCDINNLIKLYKHSHDKLNILSLNISIPISLRLQNRQKRKIFKTNRNSLFQNKEWLVDFLEAA